MVSRIVEASDARAVVAAGLGVPDVVPNVVGGVERATTDTFAKRDPATGRVLWHGARSAGDDVAAAVAAAEGARVAWAETPGVRRGAILDGIVQALRVRRDWIASIVASETGKSHREALGETDGAIALGQFYVGEGQRLFGRTTTSGVPDRHVAVVREPVGIAGLIIAANTPIANVAWKVFPALIAGNTTVLKAAEDTPATAWAFARIAHEAGLPAGVLNVVQGLGSEAGAALVADARVGVLSFTGSTAVGREIAVAAGRRLAKVSLELGGKNPFVVCDDADLDAAARWAVLSAFSNAGQRCAAGSRLIVLDAVYEAFRERLLARTAALRVGTGDDADLGPVINERQLGNMLAALGRAVADGARVIAGGARLDGPEHRDGYFLAPTVLEDVAPEHELSTCELFGPITALYRVPDFEGAVALANATPYGLTACIHTASVHRAFRFAQVISAGVVNVNGGTYGSEPHMPFGGTKQSGNGSREPGPEGLDVYTHTKNVVINFDRGRL